MTQSIQEKEPNEVGQNLCGALSYDFYFKEALASLRHKDAYRFFRPLERIVGRFPCAWDAQAQKEIVLWCSNDYLGMSHNVVVLQAMHAALDRYGAGAGGTRSMAGTHTMLLALEKEMADLHAKEAALVFSSGYVANEATLSTMGLLIKNIVFFSDSLNHASMIQGMKMSGCRRHIFTHNDMQHLQSLLERYPLTQPKMIVFESLYSMEGTCAPLREICDLARRYGALTYLDEVHAIGLYGPQGAGLSAQDGLQDSIDIIQGNFGKAYGGMGGYIAANALIIDAVRSYAKGFIFTTSIPPAQAAGALASVNVLRSGDELRRAHQCAVDKTRAALRRHHVSFGDPGKHILTISLRGAKLCQEVARRLFEEYSLYLQPVVFPTVPQGEERFRITPTPLHTSQMCENLARALAKCLPPTDNDKGIGVEL